MIKNCKLLIDELTIQFQPRLATTIGLNGAIFLQQLHFWLKVEEQKKNVDHYHEGRWWIYNSYPEWICQNFPFWSTRTLMRTVDFLENELHVLISRPDPALGGRNWYTIDYDELARIDLLPLVQEQEPVEIDAPAPELKPEPLHHIGPTHFHGNAYRHASKASSKHNPAPQQVVTPPRDRLSPPPVTTCHGVPCQVVTPSIGRLKGTLIPEKENGRAFESPPVPSPLIPPRTGAIILTMPHGENPPTKNPFPNTWAEPAWRERVLAARVQFRKERPP